MRSDQKKSLKIDSIMELRAIECALSECLDATDDDEQEVIFSTPQRAKAGERVLKRVRMILQGL